ncbi:MAG: zinc-ribbon domain-containing protein [Candidatus Odinarchaeia archaeon]
MQLFYDWPKFNEDKPLVAHFLTNYPRFWREKVLVYWDNFILTNYRIYYQNPDGEIHLVPLHMVKKWEWTQNSLTLTLKDGSTVTLNGPVPTVKVLRRAFKYKEWRKLPDYALPQLSKNNEELGRKPLVPLISVPNSQQVTSPDSVSYDNSTKFCPHCGEKIAIEDAQFCPNCGAHLT